MMSDLNSFLNKRRTSLCLHLLVTFAIFLAAIRVQSQEKKETRKSGDQEDVIKVHSNLVNFDVIVKDRKGRPVTDLKAEEFTISENGVRQNIEFFDSTLTSGNGTTQPATVSGQPTPAPGQPTPRPPNGFPRNII